MTKVQATLTAAQLKQLRQQTETIRSANYVPAGKAIELDPGQFTASPVDGKYGKFVNIEFQLEGQDKPFKVNLKGRSECDEELSVYVGPFKAPADFTTSNGKVIPAGTVKWFATQL
jgi:hypothetical protein